MRYFVCVVLLALCLVKCECTAEDESSKQSGQKESSELTKTAATQNGPQGGAGQEAAKKLKVKVNPSTEGDKNPDEEEDTHAKKDHDSNNDSKEETNDRVNSATELTPAKESIPVEPKLEEKSNGGLEKTSGHQKSSEGSGQHASQPTVTAPTIIVKNNNGDNEEESKTGNSGDKETHNQQIIKSTTTTTTEQTASTETLTTSTASPTKVQSTIPKISTLPQNVNNKDRSSSTSLVLAFAILAMLAVIPVVLVY